MQARIQNFRGIGEATLDIAPIALLCGKNGAGKTSIALAIAAAATGQAVPFDKLAKKDCAVMLHKGAKAGAVSLITEDGNTTVAWPKAEVSSEGRPPFSTPIATGLTDLLSMPTKDALAYLISLLKADVKEAEFLAAFAKEEISEETAKVVWKTIDAQGWDAALKRAKENGVKNKGEWERLTGKKHGSKKAETWLPAEWDDSLAKANEPDLEAAVALARRDVEIALDKSAVSQAMFDQLDADASELPGAKAAKEAAAISLTAAEDALKVAEDHLSANPSPDQAKEHDCPHCAGAIHIAPAGGGRYTVAKATKPSESERDKARKAHAHASGAMDNANGKLRDAKQAHQSAVSRFDIAQRARAKLDSLAGVQPVDTEQLIENARNTLSAAQKRLAVFQQRRDASKAAKLIADNQVIIGLLDETGLRLVKLTECLALFQSAHTDPLCQTLGMPPLTLTSEMDVRVGPLPYQILSASEQYRVKAVLQLAVAKMENADIVILDGADIIEPSGRGKFLQLVQSIGIDAVVCMTLSSPDKAPDLAAAGVGATYWIADTTCTQVTRAPKPKPEVQDNQPTGFFEGMKRKAGAVASVA